MGKFFSGFAVASLVWGGAVMAAVFGLGWGPPAPEEVEEEEVVVADAPTEDAPTPTKRRGGRGRRGRDGTATTSTGATPTGEATTGDDLRENDMRMIDGEQTGGEEQLPSREVEAGFDGAMGRIRRCFVLAAGDEPVTGRLTFGLRIAGTGRVTAVNLSGPRAVTTGDAGDCLRDVARGITFRTFDGPEMLVRYPITLE